MRRPDVDSQDCAFPQGALTLCDRGRMRGSGLRGESELELTVREGLGSKVPCSGGCPESLYSCYFLSSLTLCGLQGQLGMLEAMVAKREIGGRAS